MCQRERVGVEIPETRGRIYVYDRKGEIKLQKHGYVSTGRWVTEREPLTSLGVITLAPFTHIYPQCILYTFFLYRGKNAPSLLLGNMTSDPQVPSFARVCDNETWTIISSDSQSLLSLLPSTDCHSSFCLTLFLSLSLTHKQVQWLYTHFVALSLTHTYS